MIPSRDVSVGTVREQGGRFEFVDALRGFAALAVVLPHAVGLFIYPHDSWLSRLFLRLADYGRASVEVFFVVSGFAIAYSLRAAASDGFSLRRFILRRAVRLDPPYWVGLLWNGVVVAIRARATHQPLSAPSLPKVIAHIFYLQDILGLGQFNIVFWTLCLEFQLYFVFAAMIRIASSFAKARSDSESELELELNPQGETDTYGWLMVAAFFLSLVISHSVWPMLPGWFVPFFYLFLAGSLAAWRTLGRISERLFQLCLLSMGLSLFFRPELPRVLGFLTALALYLAIRRQALHRWFSARPAQWLGRISYSVYLVHAPLAVFFLGLRTRISSDSKLVSLLCLVGTYVCTIALAQLLHVAIEVPCMRLSQLLKQPRPLERPRAAELPPA